MTLLHGDCLLKLKELPDNSVDSIVTDPPYGLSFMGKKWDHDVPSEDVWRECLRVLKPGGHLLAFFGTRTYHRGVVRIEDAGFEIRDQIQWIYGSGFPKSHNIGDGRGTALKPANEPIVVARKPLEKGLTIAENVMKWGTGALNIDASRIEAKSEKDLKDLRSERPSKTSNSNEYSLNHGGLEGLDRSDRSHVTGRWPANVLFDEEAASVLDEQSGPCKTGIITKPPTQDAEKIIKGKRPMVTASHVDLVTGASRFFYVAKASKKERNKNCGELLIWENVDQNLQDLMEELSSHQRDMSEDTIQCLKDFEWNMILFGKELTDLSRKDFKFTMSTVSKLIIELKTSNYSQHSNIKENILDVLRTIEESGLSLAESAEILNQYQLNTISEKTESVLGVSLVVLQTLLKIRGLAKLGNVHSTVKPIKLMQYLINLVTPPNGSVLDPFMGSGSTGVAARNLKRDFIGIELSEDYFRIAASRIEGVG